MKPLPPTTRLVLNSLQEPSLLSSEIKQIRKIIAPYWKNFSRNLMNIFLFEISVTKVTCICIIWIQSQHLTEMRLFYDENVKWLNLKEIVQFYSLFSLDSTVVQHSILRKQNQVLIAKHEISLFRYLWPSMTNNDNDARKREMADYDPKWLWRHKLWFHHPATDQTESYNWHSSLLINMKLAVCSLMFPWTNIF